MSTKFITSLHIGHKITIPAIPTSSLVVVQANRISVCNKASSAFQICAVVSDIMERAYKMYSYNVQRTIAIVLYQIHRDVMNLCPIWRDVINFVSNMERCYEFCIQMERRPTIYTALSLHIIIYYYYENGGYCNPHKRPRQDVKRGWNISLLSILDTNLV